MSKKFLVRYLKIAAWLFVVVPIFLFLVPALISAPSTISVVAGVAIAVFGLPIAIYLTFNETLLIGEENDA